MGRAAQGNFQDAPMTARLAELVAAFGMYIKYTLQLESPPAATSNPQPVRNAVEVSFCMHMLSHCASHQTFSYIGLDGSSEATKSSQ